jgi:cytochrome c oxidase subunit IV
MSSDAHAMEQHQGASTGTNVMVWFGLVGITGIEVFLGYKQVRPDIMLTILVGLSVIKAAMIMSWFMHLKFEKIQLVFWLVPATIFCICMMLLFFFPDGIRLMHQRMH